MRVIRLTFALRFPAAVELPSDLQKEGKNSFIIVNVQRVFTSLKPFLRCC